MLELIPIAVRLVVSQEVMSQEVMRLAVTQEINKDPAQLLAPLRAGSSVARSRSLLDCCWLSELVRTSCELRYE